MVCLETMNKEFRSIYYAFHPIFLSIHINDITIVLPWYERHNYLRRIWLCCIERNWVKCVIDGILSLKSVTWTKVVRGPNTKCFSTCELFRYEMIVMEEEPRKDDLTGLMALHVSSWADNDQSRTFLLKHMTFHAKIFLAKRFKI